MSAPVTRYQIGYYQAGENALLMDDGKHQTTRKVIIMRGGHGSDGTSQGPLSGGFYFEPSRALIDAGFTLYNINAGGGTAWWNNAAMTAVGNAIAYIQSTFSVSKVAFLGASMGGGTMIQALKSYSASVCGTGLLSPALDLDFFHGTAGYTPSYDYTGATSFGVYASEMETAYGTNAAGWATATAGHKIHDEYGTWVGKGPIKIWQGDADTTVPIGQVQAFANGVGSDVTLRTLAGGGHVPPIPAVGGPPMQEYVDFFNSLAWS
jgi:pimeloyl-ACP methyl ester carboxylesterase